MANIDEIFEELGRIQEPFDEEGTLNVLKEILSVLRTYEDTEEESALKGEIETLRDELESLKRKHREIVKREDFSPEDELLQETWTYRFAEEADAEEPVLGDLITEDDAKGVRSVLTGITTEYGDGPQWGQQLIIRYRNEKRRNNGTWELEDDAVKSISITAQDTYSAPVAFHISKSTESP